MKYDWILDVLTDLKAFATAQGLDGLADQLDQTCLLAAAEIAQQTDAAPQRAGGNAKDARTSLRSVAGHRNN